MKQTFYLNENDKEHNQFYRENPQMFNTLVDVINTTPFVCKTLRSKHNDVVAWIIQKTPLLNDAKFKLITKIYWVLHGITTFPKCKVCGKEILRNVNKITDPKYKYCSLLCAHKSPEMPALGKKTKLEKYGDENYNNREQFHETMKTIPDDVKRKWQQEKAERHLKKHGVKYSLQRPEVKEKCSNTRHRKYNGKWESKETSEKRKRSFLKRYGVDNNMKSKEGMAAYINSIRQKYKDDTIVSVFQVNEVKQKQMSSFHEHMKDDSFRKRRKQKLIDASNERFGIHNYMNRAQAKQTCLRKYGVDNPFKIPEIQQKAQSTYSRSKANETKRRNHTFNTSKPEDQSYELLCIKFTTNDVIRQYRSEKYPFNCDFYVKSLDLYIECNFSWTHGKHWFDENNANDLAKLQKWKDKHSKYYDNAIKTWTIRDIVKRNTAEANKINYLVFWKIDELEHWVNSIDSDENK